MHFAPPLVHFCAYSPDVKPHHLESIKYVMIGAAPVGEALANKFKEKAPNCQFREGTKKLLRLMNDVHMSKSRLD